METNQNYYNSKYQKIWDDNQRLSNDEIIYRLNNRDKYVPIYYEVMLEIAFERGILSDHLFEIRSECIKKRKPKPQQNSDDNFVIHSKRSGETQAFPGIIAFVLVASLIIFLFWVVTETHVAVWGILAIGTFSLINYFRSK
jgi:hypothetical protein